MLCVKASSFIAYYVSGRYCHAQVNEVTDVTRAEMKKFLTLYNIVWSGREVLVERFLEQKLICLYTSIPCLRGGRPLLAHSAILHFTDKENKLHVIDCIHFVLPSLHAALSLPLRTILSPFASDNLLHYCMSTVFLIMAAGPYLVALGMLGSFLLLTFVMITTNNMYSSCCL